jgi:hypothetical protein
VPVDREIDFQVAFSKLGPDLVFKGGDHSCFFRCEFLRCLRTISRTNKDRSISFNFIS